MRARSVLKVTILGCLATAGATFVSGAGADAESVPPQLGNCGVPELPTARCGSIRVPLDRANPGLGTTKVSFALVPRRDASRPALGTIVISGGAAIDYGAPSVQGLAPLRGRRDVLLVDQRGAGRSDALACNALRGVSLALSPRGQALARIGACGRELGPRAGAYGTAAAADDIAAVREALGLGRLDLWAGSYSTYLMTVYAARHPASVRSLVLYGAYPIQFDLWALDRLAAARRAIGLVCARTDACRGEAVLRDVARLATKLRRHPSSFTATAGDRRVRMRLDESALATLVYGGFDVRAFGRIPSAVASALDGDLAPLRRLLELTAAPFETNGATYAQGFALQCHDYPRVFSHAGTPATRLAEFVGARAAIAPRAFWPFSPAGWTGVRLDVLEAVDTCLHWPEDRKAALPIPSGTPLPDVPTLVLSGDLDTNTPTAAGRAAARQYPSASFVEIPNIGHTPESSPCAARLGVRFIATLKVNPRACVGTGAPPSVAPRSPRLAADLALVRGEGNPAERRALSLVLATVADLEEQSGTAGALGAAGALRGGRYVMTAKGVRLDDAKVVRDASLSGVVVFGAERTTGDVRIAGPALPNGRLRVELTAAGGRAVGTLDGRPADLAFRF